mmetsp:Transcript_14940/g.37860  ORF Transcript_14940/g.37860 Transcript_14940/m.37860 type:complete len:278 (-) Transcript_14940:1279-2112(-)
MKRYASHLTSRDHSNDARGALLLLASSDRVCASGAGALSRGVRWRRDGRAGRLLHRGEPGPVPRRRVQGAMRGHARAGPPRQGLRRQRRLDALRSERRVHRPRAAGDGRSGRRRGGPGAGAELHALRHVQLRLLVAVGGGRGAVGSDGEAARRVQCDRAGGGDAGARGRAPVRDGAGVAGGLGPGVSQRVGARVRPVAADGGRAVERAPSGRRGRGSVGPRSAGEWRHLPGQPRDRGRERDDAGTPGGPQRGAGQPAADANGRANLAGPGELGRHWR